MAGGKQSPMRMMILLPMMFLLNKVDTSNPLILNSARAAFVLCQIVSIIAYWTIKQKILHKKDQTKIYVPAPGSPFDPTPNYSDCKETTYQEYELSKVDEYVKQTLIGAAISSFIHIKMEVNHVVMIQSIMTPMNLYDNPLVQAYLLGKRGDRIWNEKLEGEPLEAATEGTPSSSTTTTTASTNITPSEAIAQALAAAEDGDFDALWQIIKIDVNATTKEDGWTALMVACGSPLDTDAFIHKMVGAGANVLAVDGDGWSALHWSAFHGRPEAAEALLSKTPVKQLNALLALKAQDGRTALEVAQGEENMDVVQVIQSYADKKKKETKKEEESELRRRKPATNESTSVDEVD